MYINYLDLFSAQISGEPGSTFTFVQEEFKGYISETNTSEVTVCIKFEKDCMGSNDYIVRPPVSYDERSVYIFDRNRRKARLDFDKLGQDLSTIHCDPDFYPPFFAILFEYVASLEALRSHKFFCHASGFVYQGKSILCPAWRNVGKTNVLLHFMFNGAKYLSDDWCLFDGRGRAYMLPKRLHLFDYNFLTFPALADRINASLGPLSEFYLRVMHGEFNISENALAEIQQELRCRVTPEQLFPAGLATPVQHLEYVFLLTRNIKNPERGVYLKPLGRTILVEQLTEILRFEQKPFRFAYAIHKARSGRKNPFLEKDLDTIRALADQAFRRSKIYNVFTPGQSHAENVKTAILEVIQGGSHVL